MLEFQPSIYPERSEIERSLTHKRVWLRILICTFSGSDAEYVPYRVVRTESKARYRSLSYSYFSFFCVLRPASSHACCRCLLNFCKSRALRNREVESAPQRRGRWNRRLDEQRLEALTEGGSTEEGCSLSRILLPKPLLSTHFKYRPII